RCGPGPGRTHRTAGRSEPRRRPWERTASRTSWSSLFRVQVKGCQGIAASPGTLLRVPRPLGPGSYPIRPPAFRVARVHHGSMRPTLEPGDRLLVRYAAPVPAGRLVLARFPDGTMAVTRAVE